MARPFVSCICPTYNRRGFLPNLFTNYTNQTYPLERRELVILDDSEASNQDLVDALPPAVRATVRYVHHPQKLDLGKKRNMLNAMAKGDYIVCFDDDDYYPPERVAHAVTKLCANPKVLVAGSSVIHVYYTALNKTYTFGPYGPGHATNGTLAYHRDFLKAHSYEDGANKAEEKHFLDGFGKQVIQLDPLKTIICISHQQNTVDKTPLIPSAKPYDVPIKKLIKNAGQLTFYRQLNFCN